MTATLIQIGTGLFLGVLTAWIKGPTPGSFEQPRRDELRERLRDKVRRAGWVLVICLFMPGCRQTAVYVPSGEPVRLLRDVRAKVEVIGPDGTCERDMTIPAGWYALPDDDL